MKDTVSHCYRLTFHVIQPFSVKYFLICLYESSHYIHSAGSGHVTSQSILLRALAGSTSERGSFRDQPSFSHVLSLFFPHFVWFQRYVRCIYVTPVIQSLYFSSPTDCKSSSSAGRQLLTSVHVYTFNICESCFNDRHSRASRIYVQKTQKV